MLIIRFGKSTHISMISNSVTHLRSYRNTGSAKNSVRLATSPRRAQTFPHWAPTSPHRAPISSYQMTSTRSPTSPHQAPISSHRMMSVSWCFTCFNSVSRCFTSGSWCFTRVHDVSRFTCVSWCFTMFNNISRSTIGDRRSPQGSRQRRRDRW